MLPRIPLFPTKIGNAFVIIRLLKSLLNYSKADKKQKNKLYSEGWKYKKLRSLHTQTYHCVTINIFLSHKTWEWVHHHQAVDIVSKLFQSYQKTENQSILWELEVYKTQITAHINLLLCYSECLSFWECIHRHQAVEIITEKAIEEPMCNTLLK